MINYYFDNTNEMKPYTHKLDANDDTLPPDNALRIAPEFKEGFWPCFNNNEWVLVEDHRDKTVYNTETKESVKIDYLGEIKEGFTLLEPFQFSKWDGKKWILDEDEQNAFKIKLNKQLKESLLKEVNIEIDILNDKIEFDEATDDDVAMLKKWKLYRISLKKLDASDINVIFPEKPELS